MTQSRLFVPLLCVFLLLVLVGGFLLDIIYGTSSIPFEEVLNILLTGEGTKESWEIIILDWRLPRAVTALLSGAALSISGLMMQSLFRNPLAGPYILGINSGASLGVAIVVLSGSFLGFALDESYYTMILASVIGGFLVLSTVLGFSLKIKNNIALLIVGMMVGAITSSVVNLLQYFSAPEQLQKYVVWTFGSLGNVQLADLGLFATIIVIGLLLSLISSKPLNAYLLGENYARSMGISIYRARILISVATCILTGCVTAFCGPIGFIGLAVPHIARNIVKTTDHLVLIPVCALLGSILLVFCDLICQLPGNSEVLPINAVTAVLGAPIVIWIIFFNRKMKRSI